VVQTPSCIPDEQIKLSYVCAETQLANPAYAAVLLVGQGQIATNRYLLIVQIKV